MSKPTRTFTANEGQPSVGTAGPDQIEYDLDNLFAKLNPQALLRDGSPGGIGEDNLQPGAATDTIIGDRTIDDTAVPAADTGRLTALLSGLASRVKAITGKLSWRDSPALTIEQIASTVGPTGLRDGKATDAAIGNRTVSAASAPTGDTGTLSQILGWLANRLTAITGRASWRDTPTINLEAVSQYMDASGLKPNTASDTVIGQRTVDQTTAPGSNTGTLSAILGWLANRLTAITGQADWKTSPPLTLQDVSNTLDATGIKADKATDTAIGTRTVSDATAPTGDTGTLTQIVGWLANRLKAITGKTGWKDAPAITLDQVAQTVTPTGLAAGKATDTVIGNRTIDQGQLPTSDTGTLTQLLGRLANRIQAIVGSANWKDAPATTLAAAKSHIDAAAPHSGHETPSGAQAKVDTHSGLASGVHGVGSYRVAKTSRTDQWPDWSDVQGKPSTYPPGTHASSHASVGSDPLTPAAIGAETPAGAQAKVDAHAAASANVHGVDASGVASKSYVDDAVAAHADRTDNPHGVTAQQVGAVTGLNVPGTEVSVPGGSVGLRAGTGIALTADTQQGTITITATGQAASIPQPHAFSHAQGGDDPLTPGMIGAETPAAAQSRVDAHSGAATGVHGVGAHRVAKTSRTDQWPSWADIPDKPAAFAPSSHAASHASGGSDPITPASIGAETPTGAQAKVDAHANLTSAHGSTSAATPGAIMQRDGAGRAKVAAPAAADDIARKAEVDAHANRTDNPHQTTAAQVGAVAKTGDTMTGDLGLGANTEGPGLASVFTGVNTRKSRLDFPPPAGATLLAYLLRELATLAGYTGKGVLHIVVGSANSDDLYVAIHGDGQAETLRLYTSGKVETPSSIRADGGFFVGANKVFHEGNDGINSNLDADLVRGRNLAGELDAHGAAVSGVHGVGAYRLAKTSRSDQWPSWADIPDKPSTFPPSSHAHDDRYFTESELSVAGAGGAVHWNNVTNKPTAFTPAAHKSSHAAGGTDPLSPVDIGALSLSGGDVNGKLNLNTLNGRAVAPVGVDKWAVA